MTPRTIVVTGATGELGTATCSALLEAGHTVIAVGSDVLRLADVPASWRFVGDLTSAVDTTELAAQVRLHSGPADALIHLVGGWRAGHDTDDWNWLEPRILTSLRLTTLALMDDLTASPAGRVVTIGSTAAAKPTWSGANYSTLKTAASAWVGSVASGWRKAGTGAAVEFLVRSIGGDGTPVDLIADRILGVIGGDPAELNGSRIDLTA